MLAKVRLFVMRHGDSSHLRHGGDLAPLSDAAGMGNIDIQDIDGTSPQCFTAVLGDLTLPAVTGTPVRSRTRHMPARSSYQWQGSSSQRI